MEKAILLPVMTAALDLTALSGRFMVS